jgi:hypothetical protein
MAGSDLVGNMPTESMIHFFEQQGNRLYFNKEALAESMAIAQEIFV